MFGNTHNVTTLTTTLWTYMVRCCVICILLHVSACDIVLLISTTPQLRMNWFAVTQRHLRLNALHNFKLQILLSFDSGIGRGFVPLGGPCCPVKGWLLWQKK